MNVSQPVSSYISSVKFDFLTNQDVRALSVRRIVTGETFDTLLNPVPGGLYTPELGQFGDNACSTCGLMTPQCPGHCGHIQMPVLCYHPTFLDQIYKLLRAACLFCGKLRMSRVQVHLHLCKLRLVDYGLLNEVQGLDDILLSSAEGSEDEDERKEEDSAWVMKRMDKFLGRVVQRARANGSLFPPKTEAVLNARRKVVADFLAGMLKSAVCRNCDAINPGYRKDRFVKIFRKPLKEKDANKNIQRGLKMKDPTVEMRKQVKIGRKRKRDTDEAISAMGSTAESEEEMQIDSGTAIADGAVESRIRKAAKDPEVYLNPNRVHAQLSLLFEQDQDILAAVYGHTRIRLRDRPLTPDMFFLKDILVPPNRYRPEARMGSNQLAESPDNTLYKNILKACDNLAVIQRELSGKDSGEGRLRPRTYMDFEATWIQLQEAVNSLIDRDRNPIQGAAGLRNPDGIKQKLEKKEGIFRKNMMGKRVNFAARTVISPDPNIETNEIGVPPVFALKLTYPDPVTQWNAEDLQEAVRNGPLKWPGAVAIENENGQVIRLDGKTVDERLALANNLLAPSVDVRGTRPKKVHRHLNNGDIVIMNRQPTLHKPSMMCHRARVLPGEKTLRMHYANCNTYNADFDGDEMNLHFPQNEMARAEAMMIADTDNQYLSGTAGNPLRGLIQDHISMSVWLTNRDTYYERNDYMQLLYAALRPENGHCSTGKIETVPPAVMKPKALWTGKQIVTSVLLNLLPCHEGEYIGSLSMTGKSTTDPKLWGKEGGNEEAVVIFKDGYLCQGILDKKQIGPSSGGFVNAVYELYGATVAGRLLSVLGRLLTKLESMRGLSCGVEDLVFTRRGEEMRREALAEAEVAGQKVAVKYVGLQDESPSSGDKELRRRLEEVLRDGQKQAALDQLTNNYTKDISSKVTNNCLPDGLVKPFPRNQMQTMTMSGAKGSKVNASQISCNLGQQVLEGLRVPVMVSGKTLPCFRPFESSARAGGYIVDRFLTGVRPQEFFFHAMAGREGLIDTAVKTSRSGYLQRCLIKGMEGLKAEYDASVRDSAGLLVQFVYGEDGLDVTKAKYLTDFKFTAENHETIFHSLGVGDDFHRVRNEAVAQHNKDAVKKFRKTGDLGASDPALSLYPPSECPGSTSERFYMDTAEYLKQNPDKLIRDRKQGVEGLGGLSKKSFQALLDVRYFNSVIQPGEAVGVVAGQSIGEPSTQMTLNTFHLAGHSAKNVTLGIPRLREILMTAAKNISTPTMTLVLKRGVKLSKARRFAKTLSRLNLAEVLDKVTVKEEQGRGEIYAQAKLYHVQLDFFPKEEYEKEYGVSVKQVVRAIEERFLPELQTMVRKELKRRGDMKSLKEGDDAKDDARPEIGQSAGVVEQQASRREGERDERDDASDAEDEGDATRAKALQNQQQEGYDAFEDDEEQELRAQNRREDEVDGEDAPPEQQADESLEERVRAAERTSDVSAISFDDNQCKFTMEYGAETAKILMLHFVENAARSASVQRVRNISTARVDEVGMNESKALAISVAGCNLPEMWTHDAVLELDQLYTNSVHDILTHYGVEAARAAIVRELRAVFDSHGIAVDPRHLTLIADFMTRDGGYQAYSRMSYRDNPSAFMKMSFETTVGNLKDALLAGDADDLKNPSARIVVGKLGTVGTGGFDVLPIHDKIAAEMDVDMDELETETVRIDGEDVQFTY
ncbi:beta and beta-prime subunits of DNA dependent RNA-polymerase [Piedraia hortae CBS 480.64]|uniref:DNA-directed RNA polymerase subunit n=1 Tax=Piedraia hortae CBS 480.64 TaxID=1314780 RepID=A0A6A7BU92_9PEZI|nr:beta and beta-prime subunits of DNA dependent RNA-polymerase [Piedraia hortae CBS 480.64]